MKGLGIAGAGSIILKTAANGANEKNAVAPPDACTLIPSETAGPFPLDLTENTTYFRQDLREDRDGVQLNVKLKIIGQSNCEPMQNVRVNIWHCDKDGLYSGYSQTNNPGQAGLTYLRGYQYTDADGIVEFVTIFPGWYSGRICHIHFQCFVSSIYSAISQLTFPIADKNAIYAANSGLYTKGADPMTFNSDNIFSDGYAFQLATLTPNTDTGGYDTYLEVTIQGSGVSGLRDAAPETGGQFVLGQNFPNPYSDSTTVPFKLNNAGNVRLDIFNLNGQKVATLNQGQLAPGEHNILVNFKALGLAQQTYAYQLQVQNSAGSFHQAKVMTAM